MKSPPVAGPKSPNQAGSTPKKGERYKCSQCGMEIEVTTDCGCQEPDHVHLECCGRELEKVSAEDR